MVGCFLPRVHCYFDDIMGFTFSEFTGERFAIAEFNRSHSKRKISPIFGLRYFLPRPYNHAVWPDQMYLAQTSITSATAISMASSTITSADRWS